MGWFGCSYILLTGIPGVLPVGFHRALHEGKGMKVRLLRMGRVQLEFKVAVAWVIPPMSAPGRVATALGLGPSSASQLY